MKKFSLLFVLVHFSLYAGSNVESQLVTYKNLLDWGTLSGSDWPEFTTLPKTRYDTFKVAFEAIEQIDHPIVVELGTSRSFTHGGLPGCNLDDIIYWVPENPEGWDWGAGFFTRMAAVALNHTNPHIHTVDICSSHIKRCQIMTSDFADRIDYHIADSVTFLKNCYFPEKIHLLYLDTGDMSPIEPTAELQLEEAKVIVARDLIAEGGFILIDDVRNQTPKKFGDTSGLGKSKYSLPFLLDHGFNLVMDEYQVLLQKQKKN
jgi:hypothetical protein